MKIHAVFRQYGSGHSRYAEFHFYKAFESRKDAKAFCDKKNSNNNCSYVYAVRTISVIEEKKQ